MDRVSGIFRDALTSFMSRRKSPLTAQMFTDLFNRFPVSTETRAARSGDGRQFRTEDTSPLALNNVANVVVLQVLCVNLLDTAVQHITSGVRVHQQVKTVTLFCCRRNCFHRFVAGKHMVNVKTKQNTKSKCIYFYFVQRRLNSPMRVN